MFTYFSILHVLESRRNLQIWIEVSKILKIATIQALSVEFRDSSSSFSGYKMKKQLEKKNILA